MAEDGVVGQYNGSQARDVLITLADWEARQTQIGTAGEPASAGGLVAAQVTRTPAGVTAAIPPRRRNKITPKLDEPSNLEDDSANEEFDEELEDEELTDDAEWEEDELAEDEESELEDDEELDGDAADDEDEEYEDDDEEWEDDADDEAEDWEEDEVQEKQSSRS